MNRLLLLLHVLLCITAIGFGTATLFDLFMRHLRLPRLIWFLRLSLGSSLAALFLSLHTLVPAQKVAMAAVYTTGLVILSWQVFQLAGVWRRVFAFALTMVLYLNIVALSVWVPGFATNTWWYSQVILIAAALGVGTHAARAISDRTRPVEQPASARRLEERS